MSEPIRIKIINWEKFQGKAKGYSQTLWFRLENRITEHAFWDYLSAVELKCWFGILAFVSRNSHRTGQVATTTRILASQIGVKIGVVRSTIDRLTFLGILEYQALKTSPRTAKGSLHNITEHNRTEHDTADVTLLDSEKEVDSEKTQTNAEAFFTNLMHSYSQGPLRTKAILFLSPREKIKAHTLLTEFPAPEYWDQVMKRAEQSPFLCGKTKTPFRFTLSFLLQPHTHLKIMAGDYDAHSLDRPSEHADVFSAFARALREDT